METKQCRICGVSKDLGNFYKHPKMLDGHLNSCIDCVIDRVKSHRLKNVDRVNFYDRNRPNQQERKEQNRVRNLYSNLTEEQRKHDTWRKSEWRRRNKEKMSAHAKVSRAIFSGILVRPLHCQECGNETKIQAHHEDYTKPLDVEWLCQPCHKKRHKKY